MNTPIYPKEYIISAIYEDPMQLQVGIRRVIGRYDRGYDVSDLFTVGVAVCCQDFQLFEEFLYVHFDGFADVDEVVWSFLHAFFGHQLFFVKLFAWAETC